MMMNHVCSRQHAVAWVWRQPARVVRKVLSVQTNLHQPHSGGSAIVSRVMAAHSSPNTPKLRLGVSTLSDSIIYRA